MPARILIIEDNLANLELVRYLLAAAGHEVLSATNGKLGLAALQVQHPDLVISDLQMPVMDGYAFVAALRGDPALAAIPVLALTAFSMPGDKERVLHAGFDGYLSKPIEAEEFVQRVDNLLPAHLRSAGPRPA